MKPPDSKPPRLFWSSRRSVRVFRARQQRKGSRRQRFPAIAGSCAPNAPSASISAATVPECLLTSLVPAAASAAPAICLRRPSRAPNLLRGRIKIRNRSAITCFQPWLRKARPARNCRPARAARRIGVLLSQPGLKHVIGRFRFLDLDPARGRRFGRARRGGGGRLTGAADAAAGTRLVRSIGTSGGGRCWHYGTRSGRQEPAMAGKR